MGTVDLDARNLQLLLRIRCYAYLCFLPLLPAISRKPLFAHISVAYWSEINAARFSTSYARSHTKHGWTSYWHKLACCTGIAKLKNTQQAYTVDVVAQVCFLPPALPTLTRAGVTRAFRVRRRRTRRQPPIPTQTARPKPAGLP